ncbi:serine threonine kinase [Fusarium pseudoanthophilum]|uniref:non-specific serine/threonine protein kinase n=1 Tax=Fusarium pseudoanthophilum TaxID=48495 RepID=A0A8H5UUR4_9HYPO|nr:serine threonine kinase [Fusarium pseudoanthophilum]
MERTRSQSRGRPTDADKKRYEEESMTRESSVGECGLICPQPTKAQPWKQALQVEKDSGTNPLLNWEPNAMDFGEKPWLKIDWSKIEWTGPGGYVSATGCVLPSNLTAAGFQVSLNTIYCNAIFDNDFYNPKTTALDDEFIASMDQKEWNDLFDENYEVQFDRSGGGYVVFTPRALDPVELEKIRKASQYRRIVEENRLVRRFGKENSFPGHSSPKPLTEDPDIPNTSHIPLFDPLTQVVPLLGPKSDTTPEQGAEEFWAEYLSLKRLKSLNHPHLIETLSVLREEDGAKQCFCFVFPLALSNLKRLFRDSVVAVPLRNRNLDSLWEQFSGLSSGVAYLHDSAHMAHRDIKPSNILIYEEPSGTGLLLKLTGFGLSVDLSRARTFEQGSRARQSAWLYDSPEVRKASPMAVGGGSSGVEAFRNYITTTEDKISSDVFNDTRFDDGEKVKSQVLEFIDRLAHKDYRAQMLQPVISAMLAKSALRPTIADVCESLAESNFPNISYNDGVRVVRFVPADRLVRSRIDSFRLKVEEWTGRPIDWAPFRQPLPRLDAGGCMATWKWHEVELALALSQDEFDRYKATCFPVTTNNVPLLPLTQQGFQVQQAAKPSSSTQPINLGQPSQSSLGTNAMTSTISSGLRTTVNTKDIYWCIERNFTEPTEIYLSPVQNAESLDDEQLFRQVNKAISSTEGWIRRFFSWKRCTAIDFVQVRPQNTLISLSVLIWQFLVIWENKDQVNPIQKELPPPATPFYDHSVPLPHDFHMRAAGLQIVFGLRDPTKGRGETTIISMLPKKRNPPPFSKRISEPGWGLHAKMGFSQRRFLAWLLFCIILGGIFVVIWLVFINPTDLQNAFIPSFLFAALLTLAMGLLQVS